MKLLCSEGVMDLDVINAYKPDGQNIFCKFDIATHKTNTIPEKEYGTFVKTEDGGIIYFSDIAFKMLMDLSIKAQLESTKYVKNEINRADKRDENGEYIIARPDNKTAFGVLLNQHNIKNALIPDTSKIITGNLKVFSEYDIINGLCACSKRHNPAFVNACIDIVMFINDYIYLGRGSKNFMFLHKMLTEMFCTFNIDEFKNFVENFYLHLDKIPEMKYNERVAGTLDVEKTSITSATNSANENSEQQHDDTEAINNTDMTETIHEHENILFNIAQKNKEFKRIKGEDITGFDDTYTVGYCEAFYNKDLAKADSDGFLNQLIISRVNGKAAPIDLLSEAISKEHEKETTATVLRKNMMQLRQDIEASAEQAMAAASE